MVMPNMTDHVARHRVVWSGFNGGPGLSTFYTSMDPAVLSNANGYFRTFFEAIKGSLALGVVITYPSSYDELDSVTGFAVSVGPATPVANTTSGGTGNWPAAAGCQVRWHTDGNTARVKPPHGLRSTVGATFINPLAGGTYDSDGTIQAAFVTMLLAAANAMRVSFAGNLRIYSKPVINDVGTVLRTGHNAPVVSCSVKDAVAVLRSRRQ